MKKKLAPRRGGKIYEVSPWALTCSDDNYYMVDVTWNDPVWNKDLSSIEDHYAYFLVSTDTIGSRRTTNVSLFRLSQRFQGQNNRLISSN